MHMTTIDLGQVGESSYGGSFEDIKAHEMKPARASFAKRIGAFAAAIALSVTLVLTGCATQQVEDQAVPLAGSDATPSASAITVGDYTIWGVDGDTVSASDFTYDSTAKTIAINTDKHFAVQNTNQEKDSATGRVGYIKNQSAIGFAVPAGKKAYMVFQGVGIKGAAPIDIDVAGELTLILGDGTINELVCTDSNNAVIHCPAGSSTAAGAKLTIDDSVRNVDSEGNHLTPEYGLVPKDCTLLNGTKVMKGDPLSKLESDDPGTLIVTNLAPYNGAGIGGKYTGLADSNANRTKGEAGGTMTFDGGSVYITNTDGTDHGFQSIGAGIGGGGMGNGTGLEDWITINGGIVDSYAAYHAAGIGAGHSGASGNIRINGGYVVSRGGGHSNGFGSACWAQDSSMFSIVLTGGTLIPTGGSGSVGGIDFVDAGAPNLQVTVTGSSLGNQAGAAGFRFLGTAKNDKGEPVSMIEVDLVSDVGATNFKITDWELTINGDPYEYGAPAELDRGHLYLWLPTSITSVEEVGVNFSYVDDTDPANPQVKKLSMYRKPNQVGNKLKRYDELYIPATKDQTWKYYDGKGLESINLATYRDKDGNALTDSFDHTLDSMAGVTTACWPYDKVDGKPLEDANGEVHKVETVAGLPTDVGISKVVMTSSQYAETEGFKENYWGHQIIAWCEIKPTTSKVNITSADWKTTASATTLADAALLAEDEEQEGSGDESPEGFADQKTENIAPAKEAFGNLTLTAAIEPGEKDPDDAPITDTATYAAPRGYVELWVDDVAVSDPIKLVFAGDKNAQGNAIGLGDPAINATASGCTTTYTGVFPLAIEDFGTAVDGNKHKISLRYLPPNEEDVEPANYLTSASPTDDESEKNPGGDAPLELIEIDLPGVPSSGLPEVAHSKVGQPGVPDGEPLVVTGVETDPETGIMTGNATDSVTRLAREGEKQSVDDVLSWLKEYYAIPEGATLSITGIKDKDGNDVTEIDASNPAAYMVTFDVADEAGNVVHVTLDYKFKEDPELKPKDPAKSDIIETETPKDLGDGKTRRTYEDRKAVTIDIDPDVQKDPITEDDIIKEAEDRYDIPSDWTKTVTIIGPDGSEVTEIDPNTPGIYTVAIKYTTPAGNEIVVTQTYVVKAKDEGGSADNGNVGDNKNTSKLIGGTDSGTNTNNGSGSSAGTSTGSGSTGWDTTSGGKGFADRILAQTGDPMFWVICGVIAVAVVAGVVLIVARKKNKKE